MPTHDDYTLFHGDCFEYLRGQPDASVDLGLANVVHEVRLKHCEPYTKIPWQTIVETIESIAKGYIDEKEREA